MENQVLESAQKAIKYWWVSLVIGILSLALGIWSILAPFTTWIALSILFIIVFIVGGVLEIIFSVLNRKNLTGWGFSLAAGIIDLIFGLILLILPMPAIEVFFIYFVGLWVLFHSIWGIGISVELQRIKTKDWGWLLAFSILGILFSFAFIVTPGFGAGFIIALVSLAFIFYGIFRIYLAFKFKSWDKNISQAMKEIEDFEKEVF